jgi:hypothetical protein
MQEVILKAMAGKLKWWEAAEIIGVTDRTMRRWRRPSPKRVPVEDRERVSQHFHEKLQLRRTSHMPPTGRGAPVSRLPVGVAPHGVAPPRSRVRRIVIGSAVIRELQI